MKLLNYAHLIPFLSAIVFVLRDYMKSKKNDLLQWFIDICASAPVEMIIPENANKIMKLIEKAQAADEANRARQE